ncbi:GatB/YqeY domain-containing protein [Melioribacter sp. Ez-97]|uniref:GatB/YqeY domain-containing protein n=1 Tax=Melioribacter sp. Ez-97 TaxID=3423434 RepID=UPI003ED93F6F
MSLKDKINADLKEAMKSGDKVRLETIRSIRALILEFEKSGSGKTLNEEEEIKLLTSAAKKRREAVEQYKAAGRNELAEKEEAELKIIESYLPKQLSPEEVFEEVKKIAAEVGAVTKEDFPKLMPVAAKTLKGRAEGKLIKEMVEKFLQQ